MPFSASIVTVKLRYPDGTPVINARITAERYQPTETVIGGAAQNPVPATTDLEGNVGIALPRQSDIETSFRLFMPDKRFFRIRVAAVGAQEFFPLDTLETFQQPVTPAEIDIQDVIEAKLLAVQKTGAAAIGAIHFTDNPSNLETKTINGLNWTFKTTPGIPPTDVQRGATLAITLANFVDLLNDSVDSRIAGATYSASADTLYVQYKTAGEAGNAVTLTGGTAEFTLAYGGAETLVGGVNPVGAKQTVHSTAGEPDIALDLTDILSLEETGAIDFTQLPTYTGPGDKSFIVRYRADGIYSVNFGGFWRPIGVTLPTDTVAADKWTYLACVWNVVDQLIDVLGVQTEV